MKSLSISALSTMLIFMYSVAFSQDIIEGGKLFNTTCKACHSVGKGKMVGPDLKNVHERREEEWLLKFITSPMKMIESGDPYAVKLFEENNKIPMPDHTFLKESEIQNILAFIKDQSTTVQAEVPKEPKKDVQTEVVNIEKAAVLSTVDYFVYSLVGICFLLVSFVILLLYQVTNAIKKAANKNSGV